LDLLPAPNRELHHRGIEQVWLGQITPQQFMDRVNQIFQEELQAGAVPPTPAR